MTPAETVTMQGLSVLYIGPDTGTSRHRARALGRLGCSVHIVEPKAAVPKKRAAYYWIHHTGGLFVDRAVANYVLSRVHKMSFDLVWVDGGELVNSGLVRELKSRFGTVLNYNHDDPFSKRDGKKWRHYLRALPHYSLVTVVRDCNLPEAQTAGAKNVLRIVRSADEVAHAPRAITSEDMRKWASDVTFIGTWMPERGPFLAKLAALGVPLSIYGDGWQKAPEWNVLRARWCGPGIYADDDYAKAVQCSRVCLGLLSKGNRDLCTTRSFEIPYLGGLLCAERTPEHSQLYREDEEAVFWSTAEECADKCLRLLTDEHLRRRIASRGRARCLQNRTTHQHVLGGILEHALTTREMREVAVAQ